MMTRLTVLSLILVLGVVQAAPVAAQSLVAARTIRSQTLIVPGDLSVAETAFPGALSDPAEAIGKEARVILYAGRPIMPADIGPAALIERNQIVELVYARGGLTISTVGRSLSRAAEGAPVRVMNLSSRATVAGIVMADGTVRATSAPGTSR